MKDAETTELTEQLRLVHEQADELAVQEHEVQHQLETAREKAPELHRKNVEERNELGGEG